MQSTRGHLRNRSLVFQRMEKEVQRINDKISTAKQRISSCKASSILNIDRNTTPNSTTRLNNL